MARVLSRASFLFLVPLLIARASAASPQSSILAWGNNGHGECNVPAAPAGLSFVAIDAGIAHNLALLNDGTVLAWGDNSSGQCNVPAPPPGVSYVAVAAGYRHSLGLLSDGTILGWGFDAWGQCEAPPLDPGVRFVQIAAQFDNSLALRSDGNLVAWGWNLGGQNDVPPLPPGIVYTAMASGGEHTLALRSDGNVVTWGTDGGYGLLTVPALPPGLTYVQVTAGGNYSGTRRSDGSAVLWGGNYPPAPILPPGERYVEISAGGMFTLARSSDGSVLAWGENSFGQCNVPPNPPSQTCVQVSGGAWHSIALYWENTLMPASCLGDSAGSACPCANKGAVGRGCENSAVTGGALLVGSGVPSLLGDSVRLSCTGERSTALSIVIQGDASIAPVFFGDGLRCAGGSLLRLYTHNAVGGVLSVPQPSDSTISTRSGALGDWLFGGATRFYQVYYRDPNPGFCPEPQGSMFNVSNAVSVLWAP